MPARDRKPWTPVALGYKPAEVSKLVASLDTDDKSAEDIIRGALKRVAG